MDKEVKKDAKENEAVKNNETLNNEAGEVVDNDKKETEKEDINKQETSDKEVETTEKADKDAAGKEKKVEELSTEEQLKMQVVQINEKYLRLSAEFDNYRKRTLKEKIDLTKTAGEDLLKDILPVMDNFERGIKSIDDAKDIDAVKEGIMLIYNNFKDFLKQKGVKEIEAMHQEFDTDVHEALTKIPASEKKLKGKVVDVIEKGYFLNEKVMRFAKVVIGE